LESTTCLKKKVWHLKQASEEKFWRSLTNLWMGLQKVEEHSKKILFEIYLKTKQSINHRVLSFLSTRQQSKAP